MSDTMASICAHLNNQRDPLEKLTEALLRLSPEQRRQVLVQFCPECHRPRGPGWWDKPNCALCP